MTLEMSGNALIFLDENKLQSLKEQFDRYMAPIPEELRELDNLRKGAALNTAQIAELVAKEFNQ